MNGTLYAQWKHDNKVAVNLLYALKTLLLGKIISLAEN